jgi:hypothetical protein
MEYYCDKCDNPMVYVCMEGKKYKHVCINCYKIEYLDKMYPERNPNDKQT